MSGQCEEIGFQSHGVELSAGYWRAASDGFRNAHGSPCIVMAHGLGGTRAAGLAPYAERFSAAGFSVLCFDYRGFGNSAGAPRQVVNVRMQLDDWAAAIAHARTLPGIDPARIALWGSSFSGAHSLAAAVEDGRIAATSNQGAMLDGLASLFHLIKVEGPLAVLKVSAHGLLDALKGALGLPRVMLPVVADPGQLAVLTAPDAKPGYLAITPPDWVNAISTSWLLTLPLYRPNVLAARLNCPVLFCVAEHDTAVPPTAVEDAARRAGTWAEVKRYPLGHFEIYIGEGFAQASRDQLEFFSRHLKP